jgi:hypothetical protein
VTILVLSSISFAVANVRPILSKINCFHPDSNFLETKTYANLGPCGNDTIKNETLFIYFKGSDYYFKPAIKWEHRDYVRMTETAGMTYSLVDGSLLNAGAYCVSPNGVRNKDCETEFSINRTNTKFTYGGNWFFCYDRLRDLVSNQTFFSQNYTHELCDIIVPINSSANANFSHVQTINFRTSWQCKCWSMKPTTTFRLIKDKRGVFIDDYNYTSINVGTYDTLKSENAGFTAAPRRNILNVNQTEEVSFNLENEDLIVSFVDKTIEHHLLINKEDFSKYVKVDGLLYRETLPKGIWVKSGILWVVAYAGDDDIGYASFPITAYQICKFTDCILCVEIFQNWKCVPDTYRFMLALFLLVGTIIFLYFFPGVAKFILYILYNIIAWPIGKIFGISTSLNSIPAIVDAKNFTNKNVIKIIKYVTPKKNKVDLISKDDIEDKFESSINPMNNEDDEIEIKTKKPKVIAPRTPSFLGGKMRPKTGSLMLFCILAFAVNQGVSQCSSGYIVSTTLTDCVSLNSGSKQCKTEFEAQLTIPAPGTTACFSLVDSEKEIVIGMARLTYLNYTVTYNLDSLYYTSNFALASESTHRCPHTSTCDAETCSSFTGSDRTGDGNLGDSDVIDYPGQTICSQSCGCAACGCFYCSSGCTYSGFGIRPLGDVAQVYSMGQSVSSVYAALEIIDARNQTVLFQVFTLSDDKVTYDDFSAQIEGTLSFDEPNFEDWKVITFQGENYMGVACDVNQDCTGVPGDIQANTDADLEIGNTDSFRFAPGLVITNVGNKDTTYSSVSSGLTALSNSAAYLVLPEIVNGNFWRMQDEYIIGALANPGALVMNIEDAGDLQITVYTDVVCPKAVLNTVAGCYSCSTGANANITLTSSCKSGLVSVTSDDPDVLILTPTETASSTDTGNTVLVSFFTNKASNSFYMRFDGSGGNTKVKIEFTAIAPDKVNNETITPSDTDVTKRDFWGGAASIWSSFTGWLKKFAEGLLAPWIYAVIAGCLALLIVGVIFAFVALKQGGVSVVFNKAREKLMNKKLN